MPLHLLGKKSWNVYNHDNIEKVKRDEAAARAREEAEEQRMQEIDAERRMQILRGEEPTPLLEIEDKPDNDARRERRSGQERKRRKYGENETDYEMRVAYEQTRPNEDRQLILRKPTKDAPLVDHSGHIDLFPQEQPSTAVEKNAEAEREKAKKQKEYEDQYTMRFSNAAGFKQGLENPWYSKTTGALGANEEDEPVSKDVWGNEDPRRKERQAARMVSNDPLAAMRQGAAQVRQIEKERKRWREAREREVSELMEAEEQKRERKRKYDDEDDEDDLEDFRLDGPEKSPSRRRHGHSERESRHRHKSSRRSHKDGGRSLKHREKDDDSRRHRHRHRHRDRD